MHILQVAENRPDASSIDHLRAPLWNGLIERPDVNAAMPEAPQKSLHAPAGIAVRACRGRTGFHEQWRRGEVNPGEVAAQFRRIQPSVLRFAAVYVASSACDDLPKAETAQGMSAFVDTASAPL